MIIKILVLAILTEALVEIFFNAAPLQGIRAWLIKKTPVFDSSEQGHLLNCKYCTSVWTGAAIVLLAALADTALTRTLATMIIVARSSNYIHQIYSILRDCVINMRLNRQ